jgi:hypothetical protein
VTSSPPTRPPSTDATEPLPADDLRTGPVDDRLYLRPLWVLPWATMLLAVVLMLLYGREVRPNEQRAAVALVGFAVVGLATTVQCLMLMAISAARHPRLRRLAIDLTTAVIALGTTAFYGVLLDVLIRDRHALPGALLSLDPVVDGFLALVAVVVWGVLLLVFVAGLGLVDVADARDIRRRARAGGTEENS